ncbi:unnamed protein product [Caretta caretta]
MGNITTLAPPRGDLRVFGTALLLHCSRCRPSCRGELKYSKQSQYASTAHTKGEEPRWASLYSTLAPRPAGDISWRLLHGALRTGVYLARFTPVPDTCPFCGVRETLAQDYLECTRLQPLFWLLTNILLHFWLHFSPHLLIYALTIHGPTKSQDLLVNLLLTLAKMAIYKTRERRSANGVSCDCGAYFRSSIHSCIQAEFLWAASTDSLDAFEEQWALSLLGVPLRFPLTTLLFLLFY